MSQFMCCVLRWRLIDRQWRAGTLCAQFSPRRAMLLVGPRTNYSVPCGGPAAKPKGARCDSVSIPSKSLHWEDGIIIN